MTLEMRGRHCLRNASTADGQEFVAVATSKNRFSEADGFAGKSVYCGALMKFYEHVACTLIQGGYPLDQLTKVIEQERPISVGAVA